MGVHQRVESSFAQLKSSRTGGLSGDVVAVRGLEKTSIMYAIAVAATNILLALGKLEKARVTVETAPARFGWIDEASVLWGAIKEAFAPSRGDP